MIEQIAGFLEQLSNDQIEAARESLVSHGFPMSIGDADADAALEHLKISRDVLMAACESEHLESQPTPTLQNLSTKLQELTEDVAAAVRGENSIPRLLPRCGALRVFIITNRLDAGDDTIITFGKRSEELAVLIKEAKQLARIVNAAAKKAPQLDDLLQRSSDAVTQTQQHQETAHGHQEAAGGSVQQAAAALQVANQHRDAAKQARDQAEASKNTVLTYVEGLKELHDEGAKFRQTIVDTSTDAENTVASNTHRTDELIARLHEQEEAIDKALTHATGVSLFHAFDKRQHRLARTKWMWLGMLLGILWGFAHIVQWIVAAAVPLTTAFWVRLAVAPVFFYAIGFVTRQYGRDRHLEEVYAFKSKISLSLEAYRDLVERVLGAMENLPEGDPRRQYADFVVASVSRIFTPPPDQVAAQQTKDGVSVPLKDLLERALKSGTDSGQ